MNVAWRLAWCGLLAAVAQPASAQAGIPAQVAELLRSKVCLGCHQVDTPRVGPPFRAVAQRYGSQPQALEYLEQSIRNGGRYRWGKLSMAAQPQVSQDEARQIAQWILTLAPAAASAPATSPASSPAANKP
ncbi:cytochrome C [Achromobacter aloeverae]|uniref:Cytochrome C n=2 Tax=Achromobacter aloeverae TaxID=1750518 RepID=A0A4Q1HEQ7_9BURK|nr:cytochrome C [Achromobacter aloeverae]